MFTECWLTYYSYVNCFYSVFTFFPFQWQFLVHCSLSCGQFPLNVCWINLVCWLLLLCCHSCVQLLLVYILLTASDWFLLSKLWFVKYIIYTNQKSYWDCFFKIKKTLYNMLLRLYNIICDTSLNYLSFSRNLTLKPSY